MVHWTILKISCQKYTNLVLFILLLIVVLKFVLTEQSFMKNLVFLKHFCFENGYLLSFIDNCFKILVDKLFIKRLQLTKIEKNTMFLSLRYLGEIPLQTRAKLRKSLKGLLNFCKLQIVFKCQRKLSNVFSFKDLLPFNLVHGVVYRYVW